MERHLTEVGKHLDLLHTKFQHRVLSSNGDENWPPRSSDLTLKQEITGKLIKLVRLHISYLNQQLIN